MTFAKYLVLIAGLPLLAAACKTAKPGGTAGNKNDCEEVMCTEIFKAVNIQVADGSGMPVKLDENYTVNMKTNETIKPEKPAIIGNYTILDDGYRKSLQNTSAQFRFVGIKDGKKVVDELFEIGADCCHISKIKGRDAVTVE